MRYKAYQPSGKSPASGIVLLLLLSFLGAFLIEVCYVYLLGFLSNLFLRFLTVVGAVALLCFWIMYVTRWAKIRSIKVVRIVSLIGLILAFYASRCVYVDLVNEMWSRGASEVLQNRSSFAQLLGRWGGLFISPGTVFSSLYRILPNGVTSVNGRMIAGVPLLLIWLIELMLLIVIPCYTAAATASYPFDETAGCWLSKREEWPVVYVENYREVRSQLKVKNDSPLLEAIQGVHYYQREGQESYAILEFFRNRDHTGPFVSLVNVKAIQSGPKKLSHKMITLCRFCDIGQEEAKELYERLKNEKGEVGRRSVSVSEWMNDLNEKMGRGGKTMSQMSELSSASLDSQEINIPDEEAPEEEEVTVHVPKVTPEREKEYLNKKNS